MFLPGDPGFNPHSFLTGEKPFFRLENHATTENVVSTRFCYEARHEGYIGIPHGGLGMGLCLDVARSLVAPKFPLDVAYKFGGSGIVIGDEATLNVESASPVRVVVSVTKVGDRTPYVKAEIAPSPSADGYVQFGAAPSAAKRALPYYRNCFVCGHHRVAPGLKRRFHVEQNGSGSISSVMWGDAPEDHDRASAFLIAGEELHPAVIISMFDENTAWAAFMELRHCGVSTRMRYRLMRPISKHENLLVMGRCTGVRGNPKAPRFFTGEGAVYSVGATGAPELVACGTGEWLIMNLYTEQIKRNLLPEDDWQWIFGDT